jgi:methyl-accepting chemotaxis protein
VKISNLTISRRLGAGFLVVVLNMVLLTAVGVTRVEEINTRLSTINDLNSVKQRFAINFRGSVHDRAISVRDVVLAPTRPRSTTRRRPRSPRSSASRRRRFR